MLGKVRAVYDLGNGNRLVNHLLSLSYGRSEAISGKNESQLDSLIQSVRVVSKKIWIELGISTFATLIIKRRKVSPGNRPSHEDKITRSLNSENREGYKYFRVLEADDIKHEQNKEKIHTFAG